MFGSSIYSSVRELLNKEFSLYLSSYDLSNEAFQSKIEPCVLVRSPFACAVEKELEKRLAQSKVKKTIDKYQTKLDIINGVHAPTPSAATVFAGAGVPASKAAAATYAI